MHKTLIPAAIAATTLLLPLAGHAQTTGTDNAGNYTADYNGQNKGTGFGVFTVTGSSGGAVGYAGSYLKTNAPAIATGGNSFGLYANGATAPANAVVTITRPFGTALKNVNDSFSAALNTNFAGSTGTSNLAFTVGSETLTLTSAGYSLAGGTVVSTLTALDTVLNTTFTILPANRFSFTVTGNNGTDAATATGAFTGSVSQFQIVGTNLPSDQFFNSLSVTNNPAVAATPEPSGIASLLIGFGVLGGAILARRRQAA